MYAGPTSASSFREPRAEGPWSTLHESVVFERNFRVAMSFEEARFAERRGRSRDKALGGLRFITLKGRSPNVTAAPPRPSTEAGLWKGARNFAFTVQTLQKHFLHPSNGGGARQWYLIDIVATPFVSVLAMEGRERPRRHWSGSPNAIRGANGLGGRRPRRQVLGCHLLHCNALRSRVSYARA